MTINILYLCINFHLPIYYLYYVFIVLHIFVLSCLVEKYIKPVHLFFIVERHTSSLMDGIIFQITQDKTRQIETNIVKVVPIMYFMMNRM